MRKRGMQNIIVPAKVWISRAVSLTLGFVFRFSKIYPVRILVVIIAILAFLAPWINKTFFVKADEVIYYFDGYDTGTAWPSNPGNMVDSNTGTYADTSVLDTRG